MHSISGLKLAKEQARNNFRFLGDWAPEETAITKLQSRSEADFFRRSPERAGFRPFNPYACKALHENDLRRSGK